LQASNVIINKNKNNLQKKKLLNSLKSITQVAGWPRLIQFDIILILKKIIVLNFFQDEKF